MNRFQRRRRLKLTLRALAQRTAHEDRMLARLLEEPREIAIRTNAGMLGDASFYSQPISQEQASAIARQSEPAIRDECGTVALFI